MGMLKPRPAQRVAMKGRIAIRGPSGSGKTVTALRLAQGFGGRVLVIDTEGGKANLYADVDFGDGVPAYDVATVDTFKMADFPAMMREAASMADVIVIDSLSAWWMGRGGALDFVDNANTRSSMDAWRGLKPVERAMWAAIQESPAHVIATLRTKTEWDLSAKDARGKVQPRKVGTKAEQREGFEYEFDIVLDLDRETHVVRADKTRWHALDDVAERCPGAALGRAIRGWLDSGAPAMATPTATEPGRLATDIDRLRRDLTARDVLGTVANIYGDPGTWSAHDVTSLGQWMQRGATPMGLAARAVQRDGHDADAVAHWGPVVGWSPETAVEILQWRADGYPALVGGEE